MALIPYFVATALVLIFNGSQRALADSVGAHSLTGAAALRSGEPRLNYLANTPLEQLTPGSKKARAEMEEIFTNTVIKTGADAKEQLVQMERLKQKMLTLDDAMQNSPEASSTDPAKKEQVRVARIKLALDRRALQSRIKEFSEDAVAKTPDGEQTPKQEKELKEKLEGMGKELHAMHHQQDNLQNQMMAQMAMMAAQANAQAAGGGQGSGGSGKGGGGGSGGSGASGSGGGASASGGSKPSIPSVAMHSTIYDGGPKTAGPAPVFVHSATPSDSDAPKTETAPDASKDDFGKLKIGL